MVSKFLRHLGGVETYVSWLREALGDQGVEVGFLGMDQPSGSSPLYGPADYVVRTPSRDFNGGALSAFRSGLAAVYSPAVGSMMRKSIRDFRPDVVHYHGTCYQLTPSVYKAIVGAPIPSIVTAHEYKLICANQRFWDDGRAESCHACLGQRSLTKFVEINRRTCVRSSRGASLIAAVEQPLAEKVFRSSRTVVHAPSLYMRDQLVRDGYPEDLVRYADLPWTGSSSGALLPAHASRTGESGRTDVFYIGRLAAEKGVDRLLRAWQVVEKRAPGLALKVAGDGAERGRLMSLASELGLCRVEFLGRYESDDLDGMLDSAILTVHPSVWAENSPFTVRESLLRGVPAAVADVGGLPEMVCAETGTVFDPSDVDALVDAILNESANRRAMSPELLRAVASRAITREVHLDALHDLYAQAAALTHP